MANRMHTRTTADDPGAGAGGPTLAATARAETMELVDKTKLNAKIIHYYDGVYTWRPTARP